MKDLQVRGGTAFLAELRDSFNVISCQHKSRPRCSKVSIQCLAPWQRNSPQIVWILRTMGTDFRVDLVTQRRPTGKGLGLAVVEAKGQLQPLCTWEARVGGFSGHLFFVPFLWFSCRLWWVWVYNRLRYAKRVYRLIFSTDFNRLL